MGKLLSEFDFIIPFFLIVLSAFGLLIIYSVSGELFYNQLLFFILGAGLFFIFSQIDFKILTNFGYVFYFLMIITLVLVLIFGAVTRGSARWFDLGAFKLQPAEIFKPFFIVFMANFVTATKIVKKRISLAALLLTLPVLFLIFKQPDFGNSLIYFLILCFVLVASGVTVKRAFGSIVLAIFSLPVVWFFWADYQKNRILTFLNPNLDAAGAGYNAIQSIIAVGSGQFLGKGLGFGTQSHLHFLPEFHTDFIFASFAEEFGFLGCFIFLTFYLLMLFYILDKASKVEDKGGQVIILAVFGMILTQAIINIGMNLGLLPITGVTLPLISYGGSSLISVMISLGIVVNIIKKSKKSDYLEIG